MHVLLQVTMPHEPFNTYVREGVIGQKLNRVLETIKPEAAYFSNFDGQRGGVFIVNVKEASDIPALAEPFFLQFQAHCDFHVCMTPDELGRAGLDQIGKRWG